MSTHSVPLPEGIHTRAFILGEGAIADLPRLVKENFPGCRPWIVADGNTWRVAGEQAQALFQAAGLQPHEPRVFPGTPRLHPNYSYSEELARTMPAAPVVPVAVGSGVINDLVKCASGLREVPYCCVATACSVDGYTSAGGAMSVNGTKKTVQCPAPYAICADTAILATAPAPMLASGYADLLAKLPAGGDWLIADALGEDPITHREWDLIQKPLRGWLAAPHDFRRVFDGLANTGYSMQMKHDSRPASGAEHLFSHVWEMEGLQCDGEDVSHGFKVGVGSLISNRLLELVRDHAFADFRAQMRPGLTAAGREAEIAGLLKRGCYGEGIPQTAMRKFRSGAALQERREAIERLWETMRQRLREQLLPTAELKRMLQAAGCPVSPSQINLDFAQALHGVVTAQLIRVRYTVIDLFYELGLLQTVAETVVRELM